MNTKHFQWHKRVCSLDDWKGKYARDDREKYPIINLIREGGKVKSIEFAYMATEATIDEKVTSRAELEKILVFCQSKNLYPRPDSQKELVPVEAYSEDIDVKKLF
jgi:hypothetical protein